MVKMVNFVMLILLNIFWFEPKGDLNIHVVKKNYLE